MFIRGLGTATPPWRYTQRECWEAVQLTPQFAALEPRSRAILRKVLTGASGIESRFLALPCLAEAFEISPDVLQARFTRHAPALATEAAQRALADAQILPAQVDALIVSTCTGFLCPGLSSYVSERLGLRSDALGLDLVGQGCGAALPNLRAGEALLHSNRCVLSICVEVCSAAFYLDNDPGVLISACLFGDGAACAVLTPDPLPHRRAVEWKTAGAILAPKDRDLLRFEHKNGLLRNVLSPCVPMLAARNARIVLDNTLAQAGLKFGDISGWIFHAGGREVLRALQEELALDPIDLRWSAGVLQNYGNLSSPSVLFALQAALAENAPGGRWWLSSFGAGFSCQGAVLEVGP